MKNRWCWVALRNVLLALVITIAIANPVLQFFLNPSFRELFTNPQEQPLLLVSALALVIIFGLLTSVLIFLTSHAKKATQRAIDAVVQRGYRESNVIPLLGAVSPTGKPFRSNWSGGPILARNETTFEFFERVGKEKAPITVMIGDRLGTLVEFRRVDGLYHPFQGDFWGFQLNFRNSQSGPEEVQQRWQFVPLTSAYRPMRKRAVTEFARTLQTVPATEIE